MKTWIAFYVLAQAAAWGAVSCSVSATGVSFGNYDAIANQQVDTLGTITVTCMGTIGDSVNYQIALTAGTGLYAARQLPGGATNMYYNLYTDASRSVVWGDGSGSTGVVADTYMLTSTTVVRNYTVYGRIPAGQNGLNASAYLENLLVTLTY